MDKKNQSKLLLLIYCMHPMINNNLASQISPILVQVKLIAEQFHKQHCV